MSLIGPSTSHWEEIFKADSLSRPNLEVLEPVWIYLCDPIAISGFTLKAQLTFLFSSFETSRILSNSPYDSILIDKISFSIANVISSSVFATPENTILFLSAPARRHLLSSFPDTTSKPEPRSDNNFNICKFEFALTA